MQIKDLNVGELDARYEDINNFNDDYIILPNNISYTEIITNRNIYYLIGNKGTGKTALLLYISNKLKTNYPDSICSTILFKTKYDSIEKNRLASINNQIFNTIDISSSELVGVNDFKNIWKLEIYFKIVYDNKKSQYSIFQNDTNWNAFEQMVSRLTATLQIDIEEKMNLLSYIPKTITYDQDNNTISISNDFIPYPSEKDNISLHHFNQAIKILDGIFTTLSKDNAPYYICVDELETSFSSENFARDIQMIHDWIETVWEINSKIKESCYENMKIIMSVRSEILNAISQTLFGDEINKKTGSFGRIIEWRNMNALITTPVKYLYSPVIQIMLKKIMISFQCDTNIKIEEIYDKWFESFIAGEDTSAFIYERTWGKPRDAVRFLSVAKQYCGDKERFDRQLIIEMQHTYSLECKKEIYEEMSACYSQSTVKALFNSLDGYKASFSLKEYEDEAKFDSELTNHFTSKLETLKLLYNFGIIGCRNVKVETTRWVYNGEQFIEGRGWRFVVHPGLKPSLNLEETEVDGIYIYDAIGSSVMCKVERNTASHLLVSFEYNSVKCQGSIHISKIQKNEFWVAIPNQYKLKDLLSAYIIGYDNLIPPAHFEPLVRTFRATIPAYESQPFR